MKTGRWLPLKLHQQLAEQAVEHRIEEQAHRPDKVIAGVLQKYIMRIAAPDIVSAMQSTFFRLSGHDCWIKHVKIDKVLSLKGKLMPKFAANLTMMFNEVDFISRFDAAAKSGFNAVEYLFPYDFDKQRLAETLNRLRLTQVLFNLPAGNWGSGERGIGCLPDRVGEFQDGVGRAIEYAKALGCGQLNCLAGIAPAGAAPDSLRQTFVENLKFAANRLRAEGIRLLIEPINTRDIPGFYLNHSRQALDVIAEIGSDNLFLQYDIYHMQRMEGELAATIKTNLDMIRHMQLADNPGRNEPGTGEINYQFLFGFIDSLGYTGWIGCEYKPKAATEAGLGWIAPYRASTVANHT